MSQDDEYKKKFRVIENDEITDSEDEQGGEEGGTGSAGSQIEFREFIGGEALRDDLLSGEEKRRLLAVHESVHQGAVKHQKESRDKYKQLKEGKITLAEYRQGKASGFRNHPLLSDKAQFSGIDKENNPLPNENESELNDELRHRLELNYKPQYVPRSAPTFTRH